MSHAASLPERRGRTNMSEQGAEKIRQRRAGWPGESPVLAQRAVSEDPRWTRAGGDSSGPSWATYTSKLGMTIVVRSLRS
jgi:hypothetical protein